jgi:hypothetical protein
MPQLAHKYHASYCYLLSYVFDHNPAMDHVNHSKYCMLLPQNLHISSFLYKRLGIIAPLTFASTDKCLPEFAMLNLISPFTLIFRLLSSGYLFG